MFDRKSDPEGQTAHEAKANGFNFIVVFFAALGSFVSLEISRTLSMQWYDDEKRY